MMVIPIFYQLLEAYQPIPYLPSSQLVLSIPTPTPAPQVLGVSTQNQFVSLALLGDSMIDTLPSNILTSSLSHLFPKVKFSIFDYGYGSTNIESGLLRLTQNTTYLSQSNPPLLDLKPNIVVIESFAYNNFGNSPAGLDRHRQALKNIINTIRKSSPTTKIILAATIAPNSVSFANGIKNLRLSSLERLEQASTIKLYLQNLVSFAQENNIPLLDAYHPSLLNGEGIPQLINSTDHLHPSRLGAQLFSDLLAQTLLKNNLIE